MSSPSSPHIFKELVVQSKHEFIDWENGLVDHWMLNRLLLISRETTKWEIPLYTKIDKLQLLLRKLRQKNF